MNTMRRLMIMLAVLAASNLSRLSAQEGVSARPAGHVLLVKDDRALEGDIERVGGQYRIRRGTGEVWVPADRTTRLCADWEDAYSFMKSRANLGDADEHLRLARWCQLNKLGSQALGEAKLALEMRPAHHETRQLIALLSRAADAVPAAPAKSPAAGPSKTSLPPLARDISADSFVLFATRVQPILMNTCVSCHSGGRGGAFQLTRTDGGQRGLTQANLAAVLTQIRTDNLSLSPLLIKAVSPHGSASQAPIADRQTAPFKTLHGWGEYLLSNNPHLRYREQPGAAAAAKKPGEPAAFAEAQAVPPLRAGAPVIARPPVVAAQPAESARASNERSAAPRVVAPSSPALAQGRGEQEPRPGSVDPFDPDLFNRQVHPVK